MNSKEGAIKIKAFFDLKEFGEQYGMKFRKSGDRYEAICPFHADTSPSFSINGDGETFHCYGCATHGDVINFFQYMEKISNREAYRRLLKRVEEAMGEKKEYKDYYEAGRQGVKSFGDLLKESKGLILYRKKIERLAKAETTKKKKRKSFDYIYRALKEECGELDEDCLQYFRSQKINDETLQYFNIFNIGNYRNEKRFLQKNFSKEELQESGLFEKERDKFRFIRNRIIIPIIEAGKIQTIKGRYFYEGKDNFPDYMKKYGLSKYKNIGKIKDLLFNGDILKETREGETVYLCEGELDAVVLHQEGKKAVSLLGVSNYSAEIIKRLAPFNVRVCFDNWDSNPTPKQIEEASKRVNKFINKCKYVNGKDFQIEREKIPIKYKDIKDWYVGK